MRNLSIGNNHSANSYNNGAMKSSLIQSANGENRKPKENNLNLSRFGNIERSLQNQNILPQGIVHRPQRQKNTMYSSNMQFTKQFIPQNPQKQNQQMKNSMLQQKTPQLAINNNVRPLNNQNIYKDSPTYNNKEIQNRKEQQSMKNSFIRNQNFKRKQIDLISKQLEDINGKMKKLGLIENTQNIGQQKKNEYQKKSQKDTHKLQKIELQLQGKSKNNKNIALQTFKAQTESKQTTNESLKNGIIEIPVQQNYNQHFKKVSISQQEHRKEFFNIAAKQRRTSKAKTQLFLGFPSFSNNTKINLQYNQKKQFQFQRKQPCISQYNPSQKQLAKKQIVQQQKIIINKIQTTPINQPNLINQQTQLNQPISMFKKKNPQNIKIYTVKNELQIQKKQSITFQEPQIVFRKDDFQIGKIMGKGQFGEVALVRHKKTGFICGLKTMSKKQIRQQKYVQQIARQLSIQFYLSHRNITPLYGYFDDADNIYLLVEFCPDGHLLSILKKIRRMQEPDTSQVIKQICEGIDYVHKQKIIHRDIKPENILFSHVRRYFKQGVAKITDFGWAVYRGYGMRKTASGSPLYYSPQIVLGSQYDEKIDIWDIGMMTYECLIGKVPFRVYTEMDLKRIVSDEVTFPNYVDVSEQAKDFILKILQKKPEDRMTIKQMLRHPFITKYNDKKLPIEVMTDLHRITN